MKVCVPKYYRRSVVAVICLGIILMTIKKTSPWSRSQLQNDLGPELEAQRKQAFKQISTATSTTFKQIPTATSTMTTTTLKQCRDDFKEIFEKEKRYICFDIPGRLGNYMFAYASVYGMATKVNKSVVIKTNNFLKYFRIKAKVVNDFCVCETAKFVFEDKHCQFSKDLLNLTEKINYRPFRYLQSWMYFRHVADDIRQQFRFKDELREKAVSIIKGSREAFVKQQRGRGHDNVTTVGLHVRRGDIINNRQYVESGYMVAPPRYFSTAMTYYRNNYTTTLFLVCSDDIAWCKENINGSDVMFMEDNPFEVDLAVLTQCNHSIMSVGTFGWWASFLAGGETIYYKHPARDGSKLRMQFSKDYSDFFYPGWIGME